MDELNKKLADRNDSGRFVKGHSVSEANKETLRKSMVGKTADKARHWKKGEYINSRGYVMIYVGQRGGGNKSGYAPEHRLVAEKTLGRYLKPDEVVHHINGVRWYNDPENLWVYDRKEHRRTHNEDAFAILRHFYMIGEVGFKNGKYFVKLKT